MRGFDIKQIRMRSFQISGLTAKWGIGDNRDDRYKNPLHAWTISGRANGSTDFSPLLDKMGTGNSLTLSGFDGTPGSGFEGGYLMFDGVDDGAATANFTLGQNWTLVGNWEFTSAVPAAAGFTKSGRFIMRNSGSGIITFINRGSSPAAHAGVRAFNAVCSDGRLYGSTWRPYTDNTAQTEQPSTGALSIGNVGTFYHTSMRFKNLAIYEGAPLDETQCKKAYDWLQTL